MAFDGKMMEFSGSFTSSTNGCPSHSEKLQFNCLTILSAIYVAKVSLNSYTIILRTLVLKSTKEQDQLSLGFLSEG